MIANMKDFCMALVFFLCAMVMYNESYNINDAVIHALGPTFFPRTLLLCIMGFSALLLLKSIRLRREGTDTKKTNWKAIDKQTLVYRMSVIGLLLVYLLVLPYAGYVLATIVFLFAGMVLLGERTFRDFVIYILVSVALTFGLQYVFVGLLHLFLP